MASKLALCIKITYVDLLKIQPFNWLEFYWHINIRNIANNFQDDENVDFSKWNRLSS
jgi:hypothetical protein